MRQLRASPAFTASSTARALRVGSVPGSPRQTGHTWVLGSAPNAVEQPQNTFDAVLSSAWISRPMTVSYFPVVSLATSTATGGHLLAEAPPGGAGGLFVGVCHLQQGGLVIGAADELHAQGQPFRAQPARHRQRGQPRQARGHSTDVGRVVMLTAVRGAAPRERGPRTGGHQQ